MVRGGTHSCPRKWHIWDVGGKAYGAWMGLVVGLRALNRALLARQMLLRRAAIPAAEAIERLVGLQSQVPIPPYYGLWTRLVDFRPDELSQLVTERRVVRIALMRSTIHLVTARDCRLLRPLLAGVGIRAVEATYGRFLTGVDREELTKIARQLVEERPRTYDELGRLLLERWPDSDVRALGAAARVRLPMVQVPPRGIWGASGPAHHTTAESWLNQPLDTAATPSALVPRYLTAFGPATIADMQHWCGLTHLAEVVEPLRPQLRTYRDEQGRELFDLPDAPTPEPDAPAPVRLLPENDNVLLSHADRSRIISEADRARVFTVNGIIRATFLVDGFVRGMWRLTQKRGVASVTVEPFRWLTRRHRAAVERQVSELLTFAAPDATHEIIFTEPDRA